MLPKLRRQLVPMRAMATNRRHGIGTKMTKRLSFYGLVGLASLCIFLGFNHHYGGYLEHRLQPVLSDAEIRPPAVEVLEAVTVFSSHVTTGDDPVALEIDEVVDHQRRTIQREMDGYTYPNGKYGRNVSSLNDLVLEQGGTPIRSVILTSWRSGSTFLGDVLNAHPANFYHYEPLLDFGIVQVREPPLSLEALKNLNALFKCDYYDLERYLNFGSSHVWLFNHNTRLWRQCQAHKSICWDSRFVSKFCRLFPFQSMKLVRLRLSAAKPLLEDESLGIRMILLIRDPRGLLQSRKHRAWCPSNPDCYDPELVCADMVSDYKIAVDLRKKYPRSFRVVRYEELSMDPFTHVKQLYDFYGLDYHENVQRFLEDHTKTDVGGVSSTFRNSKAAPFHWRTDLDFDEVDAIQNVCGEAMKLWGYVPAVNATHQKDFDPITNYFIEL